MTTHNPDSSRGERAPLSSCKPKWLAAACFTLLALQVGAAQFVEITGELELVTWPGGPTNGPADAKPKINSFACTVGAHEWRLENNLSATSEERWWFDGTNVYQSVRLTRAPSEEQQARISKGLRLAVVPFEQARSNVTIRVWPSSDGNPLADHGINLPWVGSPGTELEFAL